MSGMKCNEVRSYIEALPTNVLIGKYRLRLMLVKRSRGTGMLSTWEDDLAAYGIELRSRPDD